MAKRMDIRQTEGQMDGHTDDQCDTIIHSHYGEAGFKKKKIKTL